MSTAVTTATSTAADRIAEVIDRHLGDLVDDLKFGVIVDEVLAATGGVS